MKWRGEVSPLVVLKRLAEALGAGSVQIFSLPETSLLYPLCLRLTDFLILVVGAPGVDYLCLSSHFNLSSIYLPLSWLNSVLFEFGIILIIGIYKNQGKHP